ncbi:hypothetical protein ACFQU7_21820 [Pseudoroseomonas wenyumeiae]
MTTPLDDTAWRLTVEAAGLGAFSWDTRADRVRLSGPLALLFGPPAEQPGLEGFLSLLPENQRTPWAPRCAMRATPAAPGTPPSAWTWLAAPRCGCAWPAPAGRRKRRCTCWACCRAWRTRRRRTSRTRMCAPSSTPCRTA